MFSLARFGTAAAVVVVAGAAIAQPVAPGLYTFSPSAGYTAVNTEYMSRDGRVVAGNSRDNVNFQGYRWTLTTGRVDIAQPDLPDFGTVFGLTPDGGKTLHARRPSGGTIANVVTRDASGIVTDLGRPSLNFGGFFNVKPANNADRVFATWGGTPQNSFIRRPYAWTQASGWTNITPSEFVGSDWVEVVDTSDDGSTWLGLNNGFVGAPGYFVANASGVTMLTSAGDGFGNARALSGDGNYVVGSWINQGVSTFPVLWGPGTAQQLPTPVGFEGGFATDVSNGGTTVVGLMGSGANLDTAFVWTSAGGMKTLADYADDFGIAIPTNITGFGPGLNISGDGTVISGNWTLSATTSEAFVLVVPTPSSVFVLSGIIVLAARRRR